MERTLGRSCLILALLGLLIAVTLLVSPGARADTATAAASTMQLRGDVDGSPATSEQAEKTEWCEHDDPPRPLKQELAFLLAEYAQMKGKNFRASRDINTAKSKD